MLRKFLSAGLVIGLGALAAPPTTASAASHQSPADDSGIPAPVPLLASEDAARILNCFHPEGAIFVSETGKQRTCSGNPCAVYEGTVDFKGVITKTPYWMEFEVQKKTDDDGTVYGRVVPTSDNAPIPPSDTCVMRRWRVRK